MKIHINSRRVPAFKLQIYSANKIIYEGLFFSRIENYISLDLPYKRDLKFSWSFFLNKKEKQMLLESKDCPQWRLDTYDNNIEDEYRDPIDIEISCSLIEAGLFSTVIEEIPKQMEDIYMIFRRTKLIEDFPLLDVRFPEQEMLLNVSFKKNHNIYDDKNLKVSKCRTGLNWIKTFLVLGILIIIMCFIPMARLYYISIIYSTIFGCLILLFFIIKQHNDFKRRVKKIKKFKEDKIKIIEG